VPATIAQILFSECEDVGLLSIVKPMVIPPPSPSSSPTSSSLPSIDQFKSFVLSIIRDPEMHGYTVLVENVIFFD
jgi:hypothetical protein